MTTKELHKPCTEFFSVQQFTYDTEREVSICPASKEPHFAPWHSTERSRRYRACAKDCNHCPQSPVYLPANKGAASAAVSMRRCWIGSETTMRPNPTRKPYASARSGSNPYLLKAKTGMARGAFVGVGPADAFLGIGYLDMASTIDSVYHRVAR